MNDTTGPLDLPVARREPSSAEIAQTFQLADNPLIPTKTAIPIRSARAGRLVIVSCLSASVLDNFASSCPSRVGACPEMRLS